MFCVYRSPNDFVCETMDFILSNQPTSEVITFGDYNVHNKGWLKSQKTDFQGRAAKLR